jgi:2-haloacid dehalogenase
VNLVSPGGPGDPAPTTVIFDLGGVVLNWRPRAAFTDVLDEAAIEKFFADIDFPSWNRQQDGGRSWAEAEAQVARDFPAYTHLAPLYRERYERVVDVEIAGTADLLADLGAAGVRLLALTNWSAETFWPTYDRFPVLRRFEGIVVSGAERLLKPDPEIFGVLLRRYSVDPAEAVFVDDVPENVAAAQGLGIRSVRFTDAAALRDSLRRLGLALPAGREGLRPAGGGPAVDTGGLPPGGGPTVPR